MNIWSAVDYNNGDPIPRRAYGIEVAGTGTLMAFSFDKKAMDDYLEVCGKATKPEHWRIVELKVTR